MTEGPRKIQVCARCKGFVEQQLPVAYIGRNLYYEEWQEDHGIVDNRPICNACGQRRDEPLQQVDAPFWLFSPAVKKEK